MHGVIYSPIGSAANTLTNFVDEELSRCGVDMFSEVASVAVRGSMVVQFQGMIAESSGRRSRTEQKRKRHKAQQEW